MLLTIIILIEIQTFQVTVYKKERMITLGLINSILLIYFSYNYPLININFIKYFVLLIFVIKNRLCYNYISMKYVAICFAYVNISL